MIRVLLLVLLLPLYAAAQTMFKWTDEKGVTHYSENPPADGKATKIEVKPVPAEKPAPGADNWRERELQSRRRKAEREMAEGEVRRQDAAEQGQRCRRAQSALDILRNARRIYDLDAKGERVYMEDSARPAAIAQRTEDVEKYCR